VGLSHLLQHSGWIINLANTDTLLKVVDSAQHHAILYVGEE
jgi:hypothetical protein